MLTVLLKFVEIGTALKVQIDMADDSEPFACNAVFYRAESDRSFWAGGLALYNFLENARENVLLSICFFKGANMCTFTGTVKYLQMEGRVPLALIEQVSDISAISRREFERNEMHLSVRVYFIDPASIDEPSFRKLNRTPDFSSDMFDLSAGGLCMVSHERMRSNSEPNFLLGFSLSPKSEFLLPAKLVRQGNCPQTAAYRFDYGFEFDFKRAPEEKDRLVMAIFNRKMAAFGKM